jgi:hypothetical protein
MIYDGSFVKLSLSANDEGIFYEMLFREGLHPERLAVQTNPYIMLDFNNPERAEFRPHHGFHLGIFRQEIPAGGNQEKILNSEAYMYYAIAFKENYAKDPLFWSLLEMSSEGVQKQFDNLFRYYGIQKYI